MTIGTAEAGLLVWTYDLPYSDLYGCYGAMIDNTVNSSTTGTGSVTIQSEVYTS